jgi:hypothetical protein
MVSWPSFGEAPDHQRFYSRCMAVVLTLLLIAAFATSPWLLSLAFGTRGRRWRAWARTKLRRGDGIPQPVNRPIEEIALDVRRRGAKFHALPQHASYVKVSALRAAYDVVLGECCDSLGQAHLLTILEPGPELDRERRRVELMLHSYGLPVDLAA